MLHILYCILIPYKVADFMSSIFCSQVVQSGVLFGDMVQHSKKIQKVINYQKTT